MPNEVEQDHRERFESLTNFKGVLKEYDVEVGRLLEGLKRLGLEDNTILIFASDNGPLPTFRGRRAGGLRGSKLGLYEGGDRMPLIVRWPGHFPAGRVDETTIMDGVDFFPTLCKLAGAPLPSDTPFDGEDFSASFFGKPETRQRPLYWEYGRNTVGFDFPRNPHDHSPSLAIRDGKWKLLVNADGSGAQLYNLQSDRDENTNCVAANPDEAQRLKDLVLAWKKSLP